MNIPLFLVSLRGNYKRIFGQLNDAIGKDRRSWSSVGPYPDILRHLDLAILHNVRSVVAATVNSPFDCVFPESDKLILGRHPCPVEWGLSNKRSQENEELK